MLRAAFVFLIIGAGIVLAATQGPFYALLFYIWNAYFRPEYWVWGGTSTAIRAMSLSFLIGLYLVLTATLSARILRLNLRTGLLMLFFVQTLVSTLMSENWDWSWTWWVEFSKVLLVSYLIVVLVTDRSRFRLILLVMALSLGFEGAKQGWAQTILNPGAQNNNTIVFLGDNNGVALGMMMLVPVFAALAQTSTRRWEAYMHRFLLVGVFLRGITTYSRGGFLAASGVGAVSLIRSQHKVRALISIAFIALIVNAVMPQQFWDRMATIDAPAEQRDGSQQGRLHFWAVAVTMATEKPITGVGFNAFQTSYVRYNRSNEFGEERSPHSVWFGLLGELGFPGLFLFIAIWLLAIKACIEVSASTRGDPSKSDLRAYANGLLTSLVAFTVAGTFLPNQYNEMTWHFISLTTALQMLAASEVAATESSVRERVELQPALAR